MNRLQKIFTGIIWLTLVSLCYKGASAQGWILPLGKGRGVSLEKAPDGSYVVGYRRGYNTILTKVSSDGEIIDSTMINLYGGQYLEQIKDLKRFGNSLYLLTSSYIPPNHNDQTNIIYKVNSDLDNTEMVFVTNSNDSVLWRLVNNTDSLLIWGYDWQGCYDIYNLNSLDYVLTEFLSCFGTLQSTDGNRFWQWGNRYITSVGESEILSYQPGNPVQSIPNANSNKYLAVNGNLLGGINTVFKIMDTNFSVIYQLTTDDLTFSLANMEARAGLAACSDGGFYYSAYRTDPLFYPYIILGKISKFGQLQWKRGFLEYIFQYPIAITESHDENGLIVLAQDEVYTSDNSSLYLIKTQPNGMIGTENAPNPYAPTIQVYPNPATDQIMINFPENSGLVEYRIISADGRIMTTDISSTGPQMMDITAFPKGLYHIQTIISARIYTTRFIKI